MIQMQAKLAYYKDAKQARGYTDIIQEKRQNPTQKGKQIPNSPRKRAKVA